MLNWYAKNNFLLKLKIKFIFYVLSIPLIASQSYNVAKAFDSLLIIAKTLNDLNGFKLGSIHDSLNTYKEV